MTDESEQKDRKTLAILVRRQGLTWVIENSRQIDTEPQTKLGKPPHYRFNIASVWACVEFRRKMHSETILEACDAVHRVMKKRVVGFKLRPGRLKGMYHDAARNRRREPALAEMMDRGFKTLVTRAEEAEKVSDNYEFVPMFFEANEALPAMIAIATLGNLRKPINAADK